MMWEWRSQMRRAWRIEVIRSSFQADWYGKVEKAQREWVSDALFIAFYPFSGEYWYKYSEEDKSVENGQLSQD